MQKRSQPPSAEALLLKFLSYRQRSRHEIEQYLRNKGCKDEDISDLINKYQDMGYINDSAFADMWIRERMRFNPKGYAAICAELYAKGVDRDIIDQAWREAQIDERGIARELIEKRFDKHDKKAMPKAMAFLIRRGFNRSMAYAIVKNFFVEGAEGDK
ncbi:MAG: regulatory protein [Clostridiales bacterium]|nr:regulatory protein [Clostridiales bacterium]MDK2991233.1 regulatory protein [Clostridiales bacterium]